LVPWTRTKGETTFGAMAEVDALRNESDTGYEAAWQGSAYVSQEIFKPLSIYAETMLAIPPSGLSGWQASGGVGLKFEANKHLTLEYELVRGFNRARRTCRTTCGSTGAGETEHGLVSDTMISLHEGRGGAKAKGSAERILALHLEVDGLRAARLAAVGRPRVNVAFAPARQYPGGFRLV
jgi:hypothetical protein